MLPEAAVIYQNEKITVLLIVFLAAVGIYTNLMGQDIDIIYMEDLTVLCLKMGIITNYGMLMIVHI